MHVGYFTDEREAALAYDAAARRIRGEKARCNFDERGLRIPQQVKPEVQGRPRKGKARVIVSTRRKGRMHSELAEEIQRSLPAAKAIVEAAAIGSSPSISPSRHGTGQSSDSERARLDSADSSRWRKRRVHGANEHLEVETGSGYASGGVSVGERVRRDRAHDGQAVRTDSGRSVGSIHPVAPTPGAIPGPAFRSGPIPWQLAAPTAEEILHEFEVLLRGPRDESTESSG